MPSAKGLSTAMCKKYAGVFFLIENAWAKTPIVMSSVFRPKLAEKANVFFAWKIRRRIFYTSQ